MFSAPRISALLMAAVLLLAGFPFEAAAQPSVNECLSNPALEGCPGADGEADASGTAGNQPSLLWNFLKLGMALVFVVALIYGLLKAFNRKNQWLNQSRIMENLEGMSVGPNRSVQAVRVGEQVFLLGVGDTVELITEITDPDTKASFQKKEQAASTPGSSMKNLLGKPRRQQRAGKHASTLQFQQLFETQLNDMKNKQKKAAERKRSEQENE
ncbi:flagellar biosynthetic protein FliO [Halobacillus halophilus]|uniref:flagellar biosynthetic protein FliO n=1 Tax=Halobacillus halophilus TaxID=1570 RepID=UPI00136CFEDB|nr:flagellar biosynthetic protein FliO [Halobacillus halophilus]